MFNPLALFSTVKSVLITVVVAATLTLIGTLWFEKVSAEKEVANLVVQKANLETSVLVKTIENSNLQITLTTLQKTLDVIAEHQAVEAENNKEIDDAPPESDGPVAPVLRDAISGIERLYNHKN